MIYRCKKIFYKTFKNLIFYFSKKDFLKVDIDKEEYKKIVITCKWKISTLMAKILHWQRKKVNRVKNFFKIRMQKTVNIT